MREGSPPSPRAREELEPVYETPSLLPVDRPSSSRTSSPSTSTTPARDRTAREDQFVVAGPGACDGIRKCFGRASHGIEGEVIRLHGRYATHPTSRAWASTSRALRTAPPTGRLPEPVLRGRQVRTRRAPVRPRNLRPNPYQAEVPATARSADGVLPATLGVTVCGRAGGCGAALLGHEFDRTRVPVHTYDPTTRVSQSTPHAEALKNRLLPVAWAAGRHLEPAGDRANATQDRVVDVGDSNEEVVRPRHLEHECGNGLLNRTGTGAVLSTIGFRIGPALPSK